MAKGGKGATPQPRAVLGGDEKRWRTEDALRTLKRADEIKKDTGLMRDVRRFAADEQKALQNIAKK